MYYNVLRNIDQGCIGSVFFEYSDEPYKTDPLQVRAFAILAKLDLISSQQTMGIVRFAPSYANGGDSKSSKSLY